MTEDHIIAGRYDFGGYGDKLVLACFFFKCQLDVCHKARAAAGEYAIEAGDFWRDGHAALLDVIGEFDEDWVFFLEARKGVFEDDGLRGAPCIDQACDL